MTAWARKEKNAPENRPRKREAEESNKVEVAPGAIVGNLRRFRAALIILVQGLPKRRRVRRKGSLRTLRVRCYRCYALGYKCEISAIPGDIG